MMIYKKIVVLLFSIVLVCPSILAQKDYEEEIYTNFERNYNDLLQSYYMRANEKLLGTSFSGTKYNHVKASSLTDEQISSRLKSIPSSVKLVYNSTVRSHIIYYIDRIGDRVGVMLGLSKYYFPIFENILDTYGVPSDLKYLVMIESAFNPRAISRAGATGLWQFMYSTGRIYDLRVNGIVDDRRDPITSSVAAAKYLKDLYSIYNDWSLVLAAYNCGPGNVNKAIKRSGGKNDFWEIYSYLPKETRNYVPAYIAAVYAINFAHLHGIETVSLSKPLDLVTDTVIVHKDVYFGQIESVLGISKEEIRDYNPQYKMDYIPGTQDNYSLKLPFKYIDEYIELEDSIANKDKEKYYPELAKDKEVGDSDSVVYVTKTIYHKVKRGETLSSIAKRYGVGTSDIKKWNRKIRSNRLKRNTLIAIKQQVSVEKKQYIKEEQEGTENVFEDKIVSADNAENQKEIITSNTPSDKLIATKANKSNEKVEKDKSKVDSSKSQTKTNKKDNKRDRKSAKEKKQEGRTYTVKSGDSIAKIAKKNGISEEKLLKQNGLTKASAKKLQIGQKIKIK